MPLPSSLNLPLVLCGQICALSGGGSIHLHLRFQDKGAGALYRSAGYAVQDQDIWAVKLLGLDQRYLMVKHIEGKSA